MYFYGMVPSKSCISTHTESSTGAIISRLPGSAVVSAGGGGGVVDATG